MPREIIALLVGIGLSVFWGNVYHNLAEVSGARADVAHIQYHYIWPWYSAPHGYHQCQASDHPDPKMTMQVVKDDQHLTVDFCKSDR